MNVLLINPRVREWAQPNVFPIGIGLIASLLRREGHNVFVIDFNAQRELDINVIASYLPFVPNLIGITGIITQYAEVKKIAKRCIETFPEAIIVAGGPLATSAAELLLDKTKVNVCVDGEGENAILDIIGLINGRFKLIKLILDGDLLKDLSFRSVPMAAYDLFPMDVYLKNPIGPYNPNKWKDGKAGDAPKTMNIVGSRGCPFSCHFCFHNFMGEGYRLRPIEDILDEMVFLNEEYKAEYIHFTDDAFACKKKYIIKFCNHKINRGIKIPWSCAGRADLVDEEMVSWMAEANCIGLWYGLESGSQKMLDAMNKKITVKQYEKAINLNKKYFPYEDYTFMVNTPGETDETIQESIDFCKKMGIRPSAVFYLTCYPGTPMWRMMEDQGKIPDDLGWLEKYVLCLNEQGEDMLWKDMLWWSDYPVEKVREWHQRFIEETDALNKKEKR